MNKRDEYHLLNIYVTLHSEKSKFSLIVSIIIVWHFPGSDSWRELFESQENDCTLFIPIFTDNHDMNSTLIWIHPEIISLRNPPVQQGCEMAISNDCEATFHLLA